MFLADYFKDINSFEYLEEYKNVDKKYAEEILKKVFVLDKEITSIVIWKKCYKIFTNVLQRRKSLSKNKINYKTRIKNK